MIRTPFISRYQYRGWCRLEVLAALCPKRTLLGKWRRGPVNTRFRFHHSPEVASPGDIITGANLRNPLDGGFSHDGDTPHITQLVSYIGARVLEYAESGSTAWDATLDLNEIPDWLIKLGVGPDVEYKASRKYIVAVAPELGPLGDESKESNA